MKSPYFLAGSIMWLVSAALLVAQGGVGGPSEHPDSSSIAPSPEEIAALEARKVAMGKSSHPYYRNIAIFNLVKSESQGALELMLEIVYREPEYPGTLALVPLLADHPSAAAHMALIHLAERHPAEAVRRAALWLCRNGELFRAVRHCLQESSLPELQRVAIQRASESGLFPPDAFVHDLELLLTTSSESRVKEKARDGIDRLRRP